MQNMPFSSEVEGGNIIPPIRDVCASYQYAITKHLVRQTQRAMVYNDIRGLLPKENLKLVSECKAHARTVTHIHTQKHTQLCQAVGCSLAYLPQVESHRSTALSSHLTISTFSMTHCGDLIA